MASLRIFGLFLCVHTQSGLQTDQYDGNQSYTSAAPEMHVYCIDMQVVSIVLDGLLGPGVQTHMA